MGKFVPWAGGETVVAAIDPVADQGPQRRVYRSFVLDGQVGDAAPCVDLVGTGKGSRRADIETGAAGATVVNLRRIDVQIRGREHRAEEKP